MRIIGVMEGCADSNVSLENRRGEGMGGVRKVAWISRVYFEICDV